MPTAEPPRRIPRRPFLRRIGAVGLAGLAGCAAGGEDGSVPTTAAPTPTPTPRPTATEVPLDLSAVDPPRRFDFWAGEWAVVDADRSLGTTVFRTHSGGNLLFERWSGSDGRNAVSMTYYDFAAEHWVKAWVGDRGDSRVVEGGYRDGAMRLSGRLTRPDGTTRPVRSTTIPHADGSIRQRLETSTDGGETWSRATERTYERRGEAGPEPTPTASPAERAAADPATLPPRRRFDFWVGTWDVHRPPGTVVVRNVIQSILDGHLILEHWDGAGLVGKSLNYWDPASEQWVKRWVPDNGNKVVMTGGFRDGAMRLDGTLSYADGTTVGHRASFTPEDDGTVTQRIQLSRDGGETWSSPWEGVYVRVEA